MPRRITELSRRVDALGQRHSTRPHVTRHPPVTLHEIPRRFRIHERQRSARATGQVFVGGPERL